MFEDVNAIGFAQAKVHQVRPDAQVADHDRIVVKKIRCHTATRAPAAINISAQATRAHLLCVAFGAAEGAINVLGLDRLPGYCSGVSRWLSACGARPICRCGTRPMPIHEAPMVRNTPRKSNGP